MKWQIFLLILAVGCLVLPAAAQILYVRFLLEQKKKRKPGANDNETNLAYHLTDLRIRMEITNFWFHLVRNNPRHREQYYFALIAMVRYENWKNVDPAIRMNWESARLSFDRMYGMVKEFAAHAETYAALFCTEADAVRQNTPDDFSVKLNRLLQKTDFLTASINEKHDRLSRRLDDLEQKLPPQENLKKVRDALNEWMPAEK